MIKTAIIGADEACAGELLRILVHHPEVDIVNAYAPSKAGRPISDFHHGLIGESLPPFSSKSSDPSTIDVAFICRPGDEANKYFESDSEDLRIVDMTTTHLEDYADLGMVYGLSEMNRKPLVRGAKRAIVPTSVASAVLVTLYPLVANSLVGDKVEVGIEGDPERKDYPEMSAMEREIEHSLREVLPEFNGKVAIKVEKGGTERGLRTRMRLPIELGIADVLEVYESIYDDHNFTFTTTRHLEHKEVDGTHKCLISVGRDIGGITLETIVDAHMRGGAGEAVHLMNLLFGLAEKTGLELKASTF